MKRKIQIPHERHSGRLASNDGVLAGAAATDAALSRRSFLMGSAKFAAVAVPAMTLLLKPQQAKAWYYGRYDHDYDDRDWDDEYDYDCDDDDDDDD